jgi:Tn3 transposase DDE domain
MREATPWSFATGTPEKRSLPREGLRADAAGKANRPARGDSSWTGFTHHLTHLKTGEPAKDLEPILAAILADGTNLGLSKMAGASADS